MLISIILQLLCFILLMDHHSMRIECRCSYFNSEWGTVCDDGWGLNDAQVVHRQLGFGPAIMYSESLKILPLNNSSHMNISRKFYNGLNG